MTSSTTGVPVATTACSRASWSPGSSRLEREAAWAAFPLTRLRGEQVAGGVVQASSVTTINAESHLLVRLIRLANENDFLKRYGDPGEAELEGRGVAIAREARREPWGLREMHVTDPDGITLIFVEVPDDHPLRRDTRGERGERKVN